MSDQNNCEVGTKGSVFSVDVNLGVVKTTCNVKQNHKQVVQSYLQADILFI